MKGEREWLSLPPFLFLYLLVSLLQQVLSHQIFGTTIRHVENFLKEEREINLSLSLLFSFSLSTHTHTLSHSLSSHELWLVKFCHVRIAMTQIYHKRGITPSLPLSLHSLSCIEVNHNPLGGEFDMTKKSLH